MEKSGVLTIKPARTRGVSCDGTAFTFADLPLDVH